MRGGGFAENIGIEKTGIPVVRDSRRSTCFLFLIWILTFSVHFQFTEAQPILCRRENKNLDTQYTRVYN